MRWIFFSLLLANVGVYIWHSLESGRRSRIEQLNSAASQETTLPGRPLMLVSELTEEEKTALVNRPPETESVPEAAPVLPAPVTEPAPTAPAPASATTVAAAPPASDGAVQVAVSPAPTAVPNQCVMMGPVTDRQYDQVVQRLLARSIVPERRLVDVRSGSEYWVVLPPFDDEKEAVRKLQEIQGRGAQGQIIPKGELANAIAFGGVFAQTSEAEKFAQQMRVKGLKVEVRELPQLRQDKWVALSERQSPKLTEDIWQSLKADFTHLKKETYYCH